MKKWNWRIENDQIDAGLCDGQDEHKPVLMISNLDDWWEIIRRVNLLWSFSCQIIYVFVILSLTAGISSMLLKY